ncbi:DNA dC-_dU-editing enzyme APOBEC-3G-like [Festucalex cinctus]
MAKPRDILSRDVFLLQYKNVVLEQRRGTCLCFTALSDKTGNCDLTGYFHNICGGVHAEIRFLDRLKTFHRGLNYTVTCYLSWSPCADCSKALVEFLRNNANVKLRIFVSRLYFMEMKANRKGLRLLNDVGVHLEVMNNKHFEYCWKTFVDHQEIPFPPWDDIVENHQQYQAELTKILQQKSVLIVGTSVIQHVKICRCSTSCHPWALVEDVTEVIPQLLARHPSVSAVVAHVGTWDHKKQQSEMLKKDYISLISTIQASKKQAVVSGPFVPPCVGEVTFSRVRQLHIWLKGYCRRRDIPYVDNFTTFLNRLDHFKPDNIHLNLTGSQLLAMNIELTLLSCNAFKMAVGKCAFIDQVPSHATVSYVLGYVLGSSFAAVTVCFFCVATFVRNAENMITDDFRRTDGILSMDVFINQYKNDPFAPSRGTYLCYYAFDPTGRFPGWGYFASIPDKMHAEIRFLDYLKTFHFGRTYTVTCFLSWSPCADCAEALFEFLQNNANIKLNIFVSRLYSMGIKTNRNGLRLLNDVGVGLEVMNIKHFEYCWNTFVDHQQFPFLPWNGIDENYEHQQAELAHILQQHPFAQGTGDVC